MKISLTRHELEEYIRIQTKHFFPDSHDFKGDDVWEALDMALIRTEFCFKHIAVKNYVVDGETQFNHLNSDQYAVFLYYLSNSLYQISGNKILCDKLFALNKVLNGLCLMYSTKMPEVFYLGHTVGTVIGNATFENYLVIVNNVHIGPASLDSEYPKIGKGCAFLVGAKVFGGTLENFVTVGANTVVHNQKIGNFTKIYNKYGELKQLKEENPYAQKYFNLKITN